MTTPTWPPFSGTRSQGPPKVDTFLGERYRRIARRSGSKRDVAVSCSILVIAWHLPSDPSARFTNLGSGFYATRIDSERRKRGHIRKLSPTKSASTLGMVRAEKLVRGPDLQSCLLTRPALMITSHVPAVPLSPDHAGGLLAAAVSA